MCHYFDLMLLPSTAMPKITWLWKLQASGTFNFNNGPKHQLQVGFEKPRISYFLEAIAFSVLLSLCVHALGPSVPPVTPG